MDKDGEDEQWQRERDHRDAKRMANTVHRMLVARGILRDPLLVGAIAQHGRDYLTSWPRRSQVCRGSATTPEWAWPCSPGSNPPGRQPFPRAYQTSSASSAP